MSEKLAEIEQDGVWFSLWRRESEGYVVCENGKKTHSITAPNEEIAQGYFEDYVRALL